ncbi:VCBS repeat-containing protein [Arcticibacterium luteifluviistationis]|uniref:RNA-binding protein n=1 Tax=Arcticibacterium luteifluviistationis TaxID=1784714 RepID=A0A2Z4G6F5_9BACT|nr:VCBS repeat-containing protein [Arcticibacterium luteifluviistationis]AWV96735.1 RNA-binding protein [Arcticibacterium luteifluviistationis]
MSKYLLTLLAFVLFSCSSSSSDDEIFEIIDSDLSGLDFINVIDETDKVNYFKYMYMYIGGGLAVADFDNDGLEDVFMVSNSNESKLYRNLGDLKFEDVTSLAGIKKRAGFDVGAAVADINNDGWLDIYITRGGWIDENDGFANMLFINNGIAEGESFVTFTEQAKMYGLDDANRGVAATFFDYDRDGDLDVYLSNTPDFEDKSTNVIDLEKVATDPKTLALKGSDKLYNNNGKGFFNDVSLSAGIKADIGFGLSPQVGDLNGDSWPDIYVCNDFRVPDFVYINQQDGTFKDSRNETIKHMSFNSMGADIGDINNDGDLDIMTLDMNPEDHVRAKTTMGMTSQHLFELMVKKDYHHQYMHNMLHLNNGNGTFSEIANMAGVANTDWSWSCLFADYDLDGFNDIYVTNGVFRDVIDRDINNEILQELRRRGRKPTGEDFLEFTKKLPQQKLTNYIYKNNGDLTFKDVSTSWVKESAAFSNGAAYADLDNDGDLELIVSNLNDKMTLLKNLSIENNKGNYVKFKLKGSETNKWGIGATVKLYLKNGQILTRQLVTTRGFLSAVSQVLHFGLAKDAVVERGEVVWSDGKVQELGEIEVNAVTEVKYNPSGVFLLAENTSPMVFKEELSVPFVHKETLFDDFKMQTLAPQRFSQEGPALAVADINKDGIDDFYIGGAANQPGELYLGKRDGGYLLLDQPEFVSDRESEDTDAAFFDVDNDADLDLIVLTGSSELEGGSFANLPRLYMNDGKGSYYRDYDRLPKISGLCTTVKVIDFENDGDKDLFIACRAIPGYYPLSPTHFLLINNGQYFDDMAYSIAPELNKIGMISDAEWVDFNKDGNIDLLLCGEFMGIEVFENNGSQLIRSNKYKSLQNTIGWWNELALDDIDNDGDIDIIAGNRGLNSNYKANTKTPFSVYHNDFDDNGVIDPIYSTFYKGKEVPVRGRVNIIQQIPSWGDRVRTFKEFAEHDMKSLLGSGYKSASKLSAVEFRSGIFKNEKGNYVFEPFIPALQTAPINSILFEDFDGDGQKDLLMAGNNYTYENETTRADAGNGYFLKGSENGTYSYIPNKTHGFWASNDVRALALLNTGSKSSVFVANNNKGTQVFCFK